ncbi:MAG: hypothetical protein KGK07_14770 [Chloroflexota bacterium]|nr:hypothetical protein [Chloroflexota bacterium]
MATKKTKGTAKKTAAPKEPKAKKAAAPKEPKAKKEKAQKELKEFAHDPRVLPFVGKDLTHTERDGTVHTCKVLPDGFEVEGVRYNSATAAAKPLQPVDAEGKARAVNGLVYWNVVKTPRPAVTPEAALESAQKAIDRAVDRCERAVEAAGDKKGEVRRALQGAVKKFEKLLEGATAQ